MFAGLVGLQAFGFLARPASSRSPLRTEAKSGQGLQGLGFRVQGLGFGFRV